MVIVYLVENMIDGKTYIGVTRFDVARRWAQHTYHSKNPRTYLHRAIAKHGKHNFTVRPVASCLNASDAGTVERTVIDTFRPDYNQTNGGEHTTGRKYTAETIERIAAKNRGLQRTAEQREANSAQAKRRHANDPKYRECAAAALAVARSNVDQEKRVAAVRASLAARVWSTESRAKLSASCMGRRYGPDVIDRMRKTKSKAVECIDLNCSFDSVLEAAAAAGVCFSNISRVCRGRRGTAGGMRFRFT